MLVGDVADRLARQDVVVGGGQRVGVMDRHLLLPVPQFRVVEFDRDVLGFERLDNVEDRVVWQCVMRGAAEAQRFVDGRVAAVGQLVRHRPFEFDRHLQRDAQIGRRL